MNNNELLKEIDKKINIAKAYIPILLGELEKISGIEVLYRIKEKERILEKIMLWKNTLQYQDKNDIDILNNINDIIGITVIINDLHDFVSISNISNKIMDTIYDKFKSVKYNKHIEYISRPSSTGYRGLLLYFTDEENISFEIQVTDRENVKIREETHEEFTNKKYSSVKK